MTTPPNPSTGKSGDAKQNARPHNSTRKKGDKKLTPKDAALTAGTPPPQEGLPGVGAQEDETPAQSPSKSRRQVRVGKSKSAVKKPEKVAVIGGSPRARRQATRRDALLDEIRRMGHANLNVRAFARQHQVSKTVVYEDLAILGEELAQASVDSAVLEVLENLRRSDEEALLLLKEGRETVRTVKRGDEEVTLPAVTDSARVGAAKLLAENAQRRVDLLQRLGRLKGPAAAPGSKENPLHIVSAAEALREHLQRAYPNVEDPS